MPMLQRLLTPGSMADSVGLYAGAVFFQRALGLGRVILFTWLLAGAGEQWGLWAVAIATTTGALLLLITGPLWVHMLAPEYRGGLAYLPGLTMFFLALNHLALMTILARRVRLAPSTWLLQFAPLLMLVALPLPAWSAGALWLPLLLAALLTTWFFSPDQKRRLLSRLRLRSRREGE